MNKCKNPECGKKIPEGLNYCNKDCLKRHLEIKKEEKFKKACPESAKILEKHEGQKKRNLALDDELKTRLTNTQWQKGLLWRQEKTEAVAEARRRGISEKEIFVQLKRSGLTDPTARKIMDDAHYCEGG